MHFPWKRERSLPQASFSQVPWLKKRLKFSSLERQKTYSQRAFHLWTSDGSLAEFHVYSGGNQSQKVSQSPFEVQDSGCPGSKSMATAVSRPILRWVMNWMWQKVDGREAGAAGFSTWQGQVPREAVPSLVNVFRRSCWCQASGGEECVQAIGRAQSHVRIQIIQCRHGVHFYKNRVGYLG